MVGVDEPAGGAVGAEGVVHVPCPLCGAINRLPAARTGDRPRCGHCRVPFLEGRPFAVAGGRLTRFVEQSDLPLVLDAWAEWCGPCRAYAPAFAEAAETLRGRALLAKLDIDAETAAAAQLKITTVPTTILFAGGREVARRSGALSAPDLLAWIEREL